MSPTHNKVTDFFTPCSKSDATPQKWRHNISGLGWLRWYKQNVHRPALYSGSTFKFESVMRPLRTNRKCSVVCGYEYGRPFADFN